MDITIPATLLPHGAPSPSLALYRGIGFEAGTVTVADPDGNVLGLLQDR